MRKAILRAVLGAVVLLAVAVTLGVAGCGGGTDQGTTTTVAEAVPSPTTTPAAVEDLAGRLQAVGLEAQPTYLNEGTSHIGVGAVEITYYADPGSEALAERPGVERIVANHPSKEMVLYHGQFQVWAANQNGLTSSEEAVFAKIAGVVNRLP